MSSPCSLRSTLEPKASVHPPLFMHQLGRFIFAVGLFVLGTLSLIYRDFALVWQPVPPGVPAREVLAIISGLILVGGAIGLCFARSQRWAALVLAVFVTSWLLLLQIPRVIKAPTDVAVWLGFC